MGESASVGHKSGECGGGGAVLGLVAEGGLKVDLLALHFLHSSVICKTNTVQVLRAQRILHGLLRRM